MGRCQGKAEMTQGAGLDGGHWGGALASGCRDGMQQWKQGVTEWCLGLHLNYGRDGLGQERGHSVLACASIEGSYSLLRQMAQVSAQHVGQPVSRCSCWGIMVQA